MLSFLATKFCFIITAEFQSSVESGCSCDFRLDIILYLESNQAPRSISLQRCEQKGKERFSLVRACDGDFIVFLQTGHLYSMINKAILYLMQF